MAAGLCMSCPEKRVDKFRCQRCKDANIARARRRVKGTVQFLRKYLAVQFPATRPRLQGSPAPGTLRQARRRV